MQFRFNHSESSLHQGYFPWNRTRPACIRGDETATWTGFQPVPTTRSLKNPLHLFSVFLFLLAFPFTTCAQDLEVLDKELGIEDTDDGKAGLNIPGGTIDSTSEPALPDKGAYTIELVTWDDPKTPVDAVADIRIFQSSVTATYWTPEIRLNDLMVTPPDSRFDKEAGLVLTHKSRRKTDLDDGDFRFRPGNASFVVRGVDIKTNSKSILVEDDTIRLRLVPVAFESTNADRTRWFPFSLRISADSRDLLKTLAKVGPPLTKRSAWRVTLFLPADQEYVCSWGKFRITEDGKVEAVRMGNRVRLNGRTFHLVQRDRKDLKPILAVFWAKCGGVSYAAPLVWRSGGAVELTFGTEDGKDTPRAVLKPLAGHGPDITLQFEKMKTSGKPAAQLKSNGFPASVFKARLDVAWTGTAELEVKYHGSSSKRTVAVVRQPSPVHLFTRRHRRVYRDDETVECRMVVRSGSGDLQLLLREKGRAPVRLGAWNIPSKPSQTVFAEFSAIRIKPGEYSLVAELGESKSRPWPLTIRTSSRDSNLLVSNITICTADWLEPNAAQRQGAIGFDMLTRAGHHGYNYPTLGRIDSSIATALEAEGLPVDYAFVPSEGGLFLEECVRQGLGYIDYISPYQSWYNEGLSFHHSYEPDVRRWIRREQVMFGSGDDYPSYWGVNYTWFPRLFGYVENGIDTDIHKRDRNRTLVEKLDRRGLKALSGEETDFFWKHRFSDDAEKRKKAQELGWRHVGRVRGYGEAFYEHFKLYADAIKEVRPDGMAFAFENAGHDGTTSGNYLPYFYGALDAATMEAYTDHGDWALEPAFTADWVRGAMKACPDRQRPFWLAAEWSASPVIRFGYMLQALARRVEGTSYPFAANFPSAMDKIVGKMVSFLKTYGGVQPFLEVEPEVAVLCSFSEMAFDLRSIYKVHACYYHLTRAQFPPQCIYEETIARGGLRDSGIKALFMASQRVPLPPKVMDEIKAFQNAGGLVVMDSVSDLPLEGVRRLSYPFRNIWEGGMGGFMQEHRPRLWNEYLAHRDELKSVLRGRVQPFARAEDERIITSTLTGGDVRFVFVINDKFDPDRPDRQLGVFYREKNVRVHLRDPKAVVYDLLTLNRIDGQPSRGGQVVELDLFNHPGLILAVLLEPVSAITTDAPTEVQAGTAIIVKTRLIGASGKPINGPTPVRCVLRSPDGEVEESFNRAAGVDDAAYFRIGINAKPGEWQFEVTDFVSGKQIVAPIKVTAAGKQDAIASSPGRVLIPRKKAAEKFLQSDDEKLIFIEETQKDLKPYAERIAEAIRKAGKCARIVEVDPTWFAEIPLRWYPTEDEMKKYRGIELGELIGIRKGMRSYIEPKTRRHVPSLGGYGAINPRYIVRHPNIVFAGGRLAAALEQLVPHRVTPDDPGPGNAVLALAFSAFEANCHTLAILAGDQAGFTAGTEKLIELLNSPQSPNQNTPLKTTQPSPFRLAPNSPQYSGITDDELRITNHKWRSSSTKTITYHHPIADEFRAFFLGFTSVNRNGGLIYQPGRGQKRVVISSDGKVLGGFEAPKGALKVVLSDDGQSIFYGMTGSEKFEWSKPLAGQPLVAECAPDGTLRSVTLLWPEAGVGYGESFARQYSDFFVADGAKTLFRSREGGLTIGPPLGPYRFYDHSAHFRHYRENHSPDWPMGMALSADGKTLVMSTWNHGTANSMGGPMFMLAMSPEVLAIDTETLETVWKIVPPSTGTWDYAASRQCLRVNSDGTRVAFAGGRFQVFVVDRSGKVIWSKKLREPPAEYSEKFYPSPFEMSEDGETLLATYQEIGTTFLIRREGDPIAFQPNPSSSAMAPDGRFVFCSKPGEIEAFSPEGKSLWRKQPPGGRAAVAGMGTKGIALVFSDGSMESWSWNGGLIWKIPAARIESVKAEPLRPGPELKTVAHHPSWPIETLDILKKYCRAKRITDGKPSQPLKLAASKKIFNLHLCYRKNKGNPDIVVRMTAGKRRETFHLDLPAPTWRTIDIPWPGNNRPLLVDVDVPTGVDVSEFQVWEFEWPSLNLAYVRPADAKNVAGEIDLNEEENEDEDMESDEFAEEGDKQGLHGKMKEVFIRVRNPDPDQVSGPFLPAGDNPLKALNGRLYSTDGTSPWSKKEMTRGLWLELHFGKVAQFDLLTYYAHTNRQSELTRTIGFMSSRDGKEFGIGLAHDNDQFFRLFAAPGSKFSAISCYLGQIRKYYGASEIEVYKVREE